MSNNYRLCVTLASVMLGLLVADSRVAFGQRIVIGGNQNNRDRDRDDDDEDEDQNRDNRTSKEGDRFLRGQGGQSNSRQGQSQFQRQFRPGDNSRNLQFGNWQGNRWQGSRDVEQWSQVFGGGRQPFSVEWHKEHPKAWRHEHHDHDDIWVVATLPGVYTWLGWGNAPQQPGVRITAPPDLSQFHDFYPLGVYSLMSGPGDMGTRVVQLAIDRHGHIAGNYYDLITDTNSSVSGDVRRDSQRVSWSVNKNNSIRFRASLNRLVQPYGTVTVQLPGGEQDWQFVRLEN